MGVLGATNVGIGAMMGSGIFILSGVVAGVVGPALFIAYLLSGFITLFTAVNYSELVASIPKQGGGYTFVHDIIGGYPSYLTGLFMWAGTAVACSVFSIAFAHSLRVYYPSIDINIVAIILIIISFFINLVGVEGFGISLAALNITELATLALFVIVGAFQVDPANFDPILPPGQTWTSLISAVSLLYLAYVGFELITTASEEIKNPPKVIPKAILLTLLITTTFYTLDALILVGVTNWQNIAGSTTAIVDVYNIMLGEWGTFLGVLGTIMASVSALNATMMASGRILYAMSRDGYFPKKISSVHMKFRTPHIALSITAVMIAIFTLTGHIEMIAGMSDFGYLMGLTFINLSVIWLHRKRLYVPGTFKAPLYPLFPIIGALSTLLIAPSLPFSAVQLGLLYTILGTIVYFVYSRRNHHEHQIKKKNSNAIVIPEELQE